MKVRICMPVHYFVELPCMMALLSLTHTLPAAGISLETDLPCGESLITRARNALAKRFLASDCTHLLFVDSDISFSGDDALKLLRSGHPYVGALYPRKEIDWKGVGNAARSGVADDELRMHSAVYVVNGIGDGSRTVEAVNDVVEVRELGTGFVLIAREVFEKMAASDPENVYRLEGSEEGDYTHNFFETRIVDGRLLSEDYLFSVKARAIGYAPRAHIGIELGHVGKMEYRASLSAYLVPKAET